MSPLAIAVDREDIPLGELLLKYGATIGSVGNQDGALMMAVDKLSKDVVRLLLSHTHSYKVTNEKDSERRTIIDLLVEKMQPPEEEESGDPAMIANFVATQKAKQAFAVELGKVEHIFKVFEECAKASVMSDAEGGDLERFELFKHETIVRAFVVAVSSGCPEAVDAIAALAAAIAEAKHVKKDQRSFHVKRFKAGQRAFADLQKRHGDLLDLVTKNPEGREDITIVGEGFPKTLHMQPHAALEVNERFQAVFLNHFKAPHTKYEITENTAGTHKNNLIYSKHFKFINQNNV